MPAYLAAPIPPTSILHQCESHCHQYSLPCTENQVVIQATCTDAFQGDVDTTMPCRNLDLEALRAAERRHAEAQIRSSFADIKQRAFQDITQRMNRSSDERTSGQQQDSFSNALSGMQPFQSTPKHAGMMQQPIQHFSTAAPVSQMVSHLRSSNGMERASSPTLPRLFTSARPPKARGFHVQSTSHSSASLQQVQGQQKDMHRLQKVPMSMCDASLMSNKLMRLTSCVKLNKADL